LRLEPFLSEKEEEEEEEGEEAEGEGAREEDTEDREEVGWLSEEVTLAERIPLYVDVRVVACMRTDSQYVV